MKAPSIVHFLLLITIPLCYSCNSKTKQEKSYIINGKIEGIKNGEAILAKLDLVSNERINIDTSDIIDGNFSFTGQIESPYLHTLFLNGDKDKIHFFLENSQIDISGDMNDLEKIKVVGSKEDSLHRSYAMDDIFDRKKGMEIMLDYPSYSFAAFTAYYQFQIHNIQLDTLDMIINNFKPAVKQSVYFKHLIELYTTLKRVAISEPAPKFAIPDTKGKIVQLDDFKGKYVLIDFWASWCAPCRAANPALVEVYHHFSDKNFAILGISVDKNKEQWEKAIEADQLPWVQLSTLEGWGEVSDTYGVKAIPQNFLLDPDGIIIGKNLEPEHLIEKLEVLLTD